MHSSNNRKKFLSAESTFRELVSFICSSVDGLITLLISLACFSLGIAYLIDFLPENDLIEPVTLTLTPAVLFFSFIQIRLNTHSDDWFSIICYIPAMLVISSISFHKAIGELLCDTIACLKHLID